MKKLNAVIVFPLLTLVAFLIAVAQPFGLSPDYQNYEIFFDMARREFGRGMQTRFEPGFVLVSGILTNAISSDLLIYGLLVIVAVSIKLFTFEKFVPVQKSLGRYYLFLTILFYATRFFPLHELTQLRVSIATAAILVIALLVWTGKRLRGTLLVPLATCFHYSSLILIPFFYLPKTRRVTAVVLTFATGVLLKVLATPLVGIAQGYFIVFSTYEFGFANEVPSLLSPVFFPEFFMIVVSLIFWNDLTDLMRRIVFLQMIGFALFYGLIDFTVVATPGRDLFSLMWTVFLVQGAAVPLRVRVLLHVFVGMSVALATYQYVILDFFQR